MICYNGIQSTTSIVVVARTTVAGDSVLTIGTKTNTVHGDPAVSDGLVRLEITGLTPDTSYNWSVSVADGGSATGKNTTFPTSGSCPIGLMGCQETGGAHSLRAMRQNRVYAVIHSGDESYGEPVVFGGAIADFESQAKHYEFRQTFRTDPDKITEIRDMGFGYVTDDHDWGLNDVGDDLTYARQKCLDAGYDASFGSMTQGEFDNAKDSAAEATRAYSLGNPINTDSESHGGGDGSANYFRFTAGDLEYFVLSQVQISDDQLRGVPNTVTQPHAILGDDGKQEAWLKARLSASPKKFKCIISPKGTLFFRSINGESWRAYNDLYPLIDWIDQNVTGVMFMCNDHHIPGMYCSKKGSYGVNTYTPDNASGQIAYDFDHVALLTGPSGKPLNMRSADAGDDGPKTNGPARTALENGALYWVGPEGSTYLPNDTAEFLGNTLFFRNPELQCYGVADISPNGNMRGSCMANNNSEEIFHAEVAPDTNFVVGT